MNNKKLILLTIVITLLLVLTTVFSAAAQTIKVRIEGLNDTLYERDITVTNEVYAEDVLYNSIGQSNVDGINGEFGLLISGLMDEEAAAGTYWGLYTVDNGNVQSSMTGVSSLEVCEIGDELLFHVTENSWPSETAIADILLNNTNNDYTVNVQSNGSGLQDVTVNVSYLGEFLTDDSGNASFTLNDGIYDIDIKKDGDYPEILRKHYRVKSGDVANRIESAINSLKNYYNNQGELNYRSACSLNVTTESVEDLRNIHLRYSPRDNTSANNCASNIIGLLAAGYDPYQYNSTNYINLLKQSQRTEGENIGKFIIDQYDNSPTVTAYSIIALDMAEAKYNDTAAVNALLSFVNEDGSFGSYHDVDTTAISLMALANYKEIDGVITAINNGFDFIKTKQLDTGGFSSGWSEAESPYSITTVIQALVANNINPLSSDWLKNSNNMVDALLAYMIVDHFEYTSQYGTDISSITDQAFTALADLYNGRSMFADITKTVIECQQSFTVTRSGDGSLNKGQDASISLSIANNTDTAETATFILALYDTDNNEMVNYNYFSKEFSPNSSETVTSGFYIPQQGNYEVRAFVWDSIENMNVLSEPEIINVQ